MNRKKIGINLDEIINKKEVKDIKNENKEKVFFNLHYPKNLHYQLKIISLKKNKPLKEILLEAINEYIEKNKNLI